MAANTAQGRKILEIGKADFVFQEGSEAGYAYVLSEGTLEIVRKSADGNQVLGKTTGKIHILCQDSGIL